MPSLRDDAVVLSEANRSRREPVVPGAHTNVAGAVYGQILSTSLVVALALDKALSLAEILGTVVSTATVFWLAHAYAQTAAEWMAGERSRRLAGFRHELALQWPIVQAALPATLALLVGVTGGLSRNAAVWLAIGLGIVDLFAWGIAIGRRSRLGTGRSALVGAANACFGALMILLKVLVH